MKIYVVRHGETNENKATKLMGRSHGTLSEKGKYQARLTGEALKERNFRIIYSSPLDRCFETAQILNEFFQKDIIKDELLKTPDLESSVFVYSNLPDFSAASLHAFKKSLTKGVRP